MLKRLFKRIELRDSQDKSSGNGTVSVLNGAVFRAGTEAGTSMSGLSVLLRQAKILPVVERIAYEFVDLQQPVQSHFHLFGFNTKAG